MGVETKKASSTTKRRGVNSGATLAWGIGIGVGMGTAVGVATGELWFWLALGTAIGAATPVLNIFKQ